MISQAKNLCHDERIAKSAVRPSTPLTEPTIALEPQSFAPKTNTSQNGRMEILEVAQIVFDKELQVRIETCQQTIHEYYEVMETEEDMKKFPPLVVYFDGCYYWLADGHHRYWAIFRRGFEKVLVKVIDGTHDDAILAAVRLNSQNGLRLKDDDWEKIIPLITNKKQWKDWSNRKLGEELGCSYKTIERYRSDISGGTAVPPEKRKGKDGKSYPARKVISKNAISVPKENKPDRANQGNSSDIPVSEHLPERKPSSPDSHPESKLEDGYYLTFSETKEKDSQTGKTVSITAQLLSLSNPERLIASLFILCPVKN